MAKISVVIRAYNEERHIGKLLKGIKEQSIPEVEVVLVDSGSTDRTVKIARRHGAKIVNIEKDTFSFGRALNKGCEAATGELLVFASAHVYPLRRDWLERLVAPLADPDVAVSYGRQVGNEVTKFSEKQIFLSWFPAVSASHQKHSFCNNANCAIRRSGWEAQRYNEFLTGLEDLDWAKRMTSNGGYVSYVADATIAHVHDETWSRIRTRYRREALALKQIEPGIKFGFFDFFALSAQNIFSDMLAARNEGVLSSNWLGIILFRLNQFFGTWRGHQTHGEIDATLRARFYYPTKDEVNHTVGTNDQSEVHLRIEYDT